MEADFDDLNNQAFGKKSEYDCGRKNKYRRSMWLLVLHL